MGEIGFRVRDIVPSQEDLESMGRKQYQHPSIFKTGGARPRWYFRAYVTVRTAAKKDARPPRRFYLGFCSEIGKREAEKLRDRILSEVINKPQILIPSQVLFGEVLSAYERDHLSALRETTQKTQQHIIDKYIRPGLGSLRMCDVDVRAIQRWLSGLALAYLTKDRYLALLRIIWGRAEKWGFTTQRFPEDGYQLGVRRDVKGHRMPSMDQLRRLILALEDPYRGMAEVAICTGLRISEILGLQWSDLEGGVLTVQRRVSATGGVDVPKNGKFRVFDARPIAAVLARMPRESQWIFGQRPYKTCQARMQAAGNLAGITIARFGWHHLRAVCNTLMRSGGADSVDRQALLGHSDERTNAIYVMQSEDDVRRRGDLMMAVQAAVMGGTKGVQ